MCNNVCMCVYVCECVRVHACKRVTSLLYSLSLRSIWHGYRVCDVEVTVEGHVIGWKRFAQALGRMNNFTTFNLCNDTDNDSDTDSQIASEHVHVDTDTQHTDSDCKIVDANTHTDSDCILVDANTHTESYGGREGPTAPAIRSRQTASGCVIYRTRQLICRERLMENCLAYRVVTYHAQQLICRARLMGKYYLPCAAINMPRAAYGKIKRQAQRLYYFTYRVRQLICRARLINNCKRLLCAYRARANNNR